MVQARSDKYWFGDFELNTVEWVLRQKGEILPLAPKALQALELLVRNGGSVVSRKDMVESLWPDAFVEESNLTVTISMLRRALGDSETGTKFIETVPKRGYRFVPLVKTIRNGRLSRDSFSSMGIVRLTNAGRVLDVELTPHRGDEALGHCQSQADPRQVALRIVADFGPDPSVPRDPQWFRNLVAGPDAMPRALDV